MNIKKILFNSICIFLISCIFHFVYDIFPSFITSIFFPTNESIFQHLKLIFSSAIFFTIISNIFYKDKNVFLISFLRGILAIIILLIIYLPVRNIFGEILPLTLFILFISIFISEIIINFFIKKDYKYNLFSIILMILSFIIFTYFTYNPIKTFLFLHILKDKYLLSSIYLFF